MKISYDNKYLFSASKDGSLLIMDIKDKDPRGGNLREREVQILDFSDEILTEKQEMDDYKSQREQLENDLAQIKDPSQATVGEKVGTNEQEDKIAKLQEEIDLIGSQHKQKHSNLTLQKKTMEEDFEKQIKELAEQQNEELESKRSEYSQKMLEDATRYQELQKAKEEEARRYRQSQEAMLKQHESAVTE